MNWAIDHYRVDDSASINNSGWAVMIEVLMSGRKKTTAAFLASITVREFHIWFPDSHVF
jgi:hypothetical protein